VLGANPRPLGIGHHYRSLEKRSVGFVLVSAGAHDDVNKVLWTALGWDSMADVNELLRQYTRLLVGPGIDELFAQGLLALERNWRGPLAVNAGVPLTLRQFELMERIAPQETRNAWRFQLALFRAYLDAYVQTRLFAERRREDEARAHLRGAAKQGTVKALAAAEVALANEEAPTAPDWRARLVQLGDSLFSSIKLQLSVSRHKAASVAGGAVLDSMDAPLGDGPWMRRRFAEIRLLETEGRRLEAIEAVLGRADPGPGGRYDDLGNVAAQPHLIRGLDLDEDDAFEEIGLLGFAWRSGGIAPAAADTLMAAPDGPAASWDCAGSRGGFPLELRYAGLDGGARYRVRVAYAAGPRRRIRMLGDERPLHAFLESPAQPVDVDVPEELTRDGTLRLSWLEAPDAAPGCQVSEVWLMRR
jgi:hypothetical protein